MQNGDLIPNGADGGLTNILSGGGKADRVNSDTANQLGRGAGIEQITLNKNQLPDHDHTLEGNNGGQYYAISKDSKQTIDTNSMIGNGLTNSTTSNLLSTTGSINEETTGQPISIMNPYLAINYIIYAGVV
jgi:microcystin-dependent protein